MCGNAEICTRVRCEELVEDLLSSKSLLGGCFFVHGVPELVVLAEGGLELPSGVFRGDYRLGGPLIACVETDPELQRQAHSVCLMETHDSRRFSLKVGTTPFWSKGLAHVMESVLAERRRGLEYKACGKGTSASICCSQPAATERAWFIPFGVSAGSGPHLQKHLS